MTYTNNERALIELQWYWRTGDVRLDACLWLRKYLDAREAGCGAQRAWAGDRRPVQGGGLCLAN